MAPTGPEPRTLGLLLADALPRLGLTLPEMQDAQCHEVGNQYFLEVSAACSFEALPAAKARYFFYHTHLLDEAARLRRALPERALKRQDAASLTLFVQHYQHGLQNLLAQVHAQTESAHRAGRYGQASDYSLAEVYHLLYVELEKLLVYIEQAFPDQLNLNAPLSYHRRLQALTDVQTPLAAMLMSLHTAETIPARLRDVVRDCLNRLLITVHDADLSYQDLLYPRLLLRELHGRLQRGWSLNTQKLGGLLVRYNSNNQAFFSLVTAHLRTEAAAAGDEPADRLPVVLFHLKLYRQLQPATELRYEPTLPPLRTQVLNWLEEEREYLSGQVAAAPAARALASHEVARILSPLSVAQMAQLLRTLYDASVFGKANQRDLFHLVAANFRTAHQEQIPEKSLADKYYNTEDSTRQAVENFLSKMLINLRRGS